MTVNEAFVSRGDSMHNSAALLRELLLEGVRVLNYAGDAGEPAQLFWVNRVRANSQVDFL